MKFQRKQNKLYSGDRTYLITERKHTTPQKSRFFLLRLIGKKRSYISSLYGTPPHFELEYKGIRYQLHLSETSATLTEKKVGATNV